MYLFALLDHYYLYNCILTYSQVHICIHMFVFGVLNVSSYVAAWALVVSHKLPRYNELCCIVEQ